MEIDGKSCYSVKKLISTSKRRAEHPFASQNTQYILFVYFVKVFDYVNVLKVKPHRDLALFSQGKPRYEEQGESWYQMR